MNNAEVKNEKIADISSLLQQIKKEAQNEDLIIIQKMVFWKVINNRNEKIIQIKMDKLVHVGLSIFWQLVKHYSMIFGMITLNQGTSKMRNYATWVQTALLFILKLKIFLKTFQMMLKKGLIHQMTKSICCSKQERSKSDQNNER